MSMMAVFSALKALFSLTFTDDFIMHKSGCMKTFTDDFIKQKSGCMKTISQCDIHGFKVNNTQCL